MAAPLVDISILGDKVLERKLAALAGPKQNRATGRSLKKSATRLKRATVAKVSGGFFKEPTGNLLGALKDTKTKQIKARSARRHGIVGAVWLWPTRAALGLPQDGGYYPTALEYGYIHAKSGTHIPAKSYIRSTVNQNTSKEHAFLRREIGTQIERTFRKTK